MRGRLLAALRVRRAARDLDPDATDDVERAARRRLSRGTDYRPADVREEPVSRTVSLAEGGRL